MGSSTLTNHTNFLDLLTIPTLISNRLFFSLGLATELLQGSLILKSYRKGYFQSVKKRVMCKGWSTGVEPEPFGYGTWGPRRAAAWNQAARRPVGRVPQSSMRQYQNFAYLFRYLQTALGIWLRVLTCKLGMGPDFGARVYGSPLHILKISPNGHCPHLRVWAGFHPGAAICRCVECWLRGMLDRGKEAYIQDVTRSQLRRMGRLACIAYKCSRLPQVCGR
jgi:hypothetical protein